MIKIENDCVGCPPEIGCMGSACPYRNVKTTVCDNCGKYAEYNIDGEDFCSECLEEHLKILFNEFSLYEKLDMLNIDYSTID